MQLKEVMGINTVACVSDSNTLVDPMGLMGNKKMIVGNWGIRFCYK